MHILITRPLEDCKNLLIKFKNLGHMVSNLPVIKIRKVEYEDLNFNNYSAIIFTSSNSIKNLSLDKINKTIKCFCVGSVTEKFARSSGFQNVISADGNVRVLKELILQNHDKKDGKILYISSEIISSNLDKELSNEGYEISRIINYTVEHINDFQNNIIEDLKKNIPDIVFVYSENSAKSFLNIIKKYQLIDSWMNTNLMCIGEKTSSVLNDVKWKKIFLFSPGEEEFLLYKV
jgi:uroporphyrinogen-III synthase|tara:strand:+ start:1496 stop:2194 length:699 start_codon:yes stop_codon:yes gene_type:complete